MSSGGFRALCGACSMLLLALSAAALSPETVLSSGAVPPHLAGRFRDVRAFQQSSFGQYYVFDRRAHTVYGLDQSMDSVWPIIQIGPEPGRVIGPTVLSVAPDGTFLVADAPQGRPRVQIFSPVGFRTAGFTLPQRERARVAFDDIILSGVASIHYTGSAILISQPESGSLFTEYTPSGRQARSIGRLRATGHEADPDVHIALNSGTPLVDPEGGFFFVFQAGVPVFQKFGRDGRLLFERRIQGPEVDQLLAGLPDRWPRREGELPLVTATVRAAAVDRVGNLWISLATPFTYVYDREGDKTRVVQFRGTDMIAASGLFFAPDGRLLVTPGLYAFDVAPRQSSPAR
jgi:hypothetical protein